MRAVVPAPGAKVPSKEAIEEYCRTLIRDYDPWQTAGSCRFDRDAAYTAIRFFHSMLRHVKGAMAGEPFVLEPWQIAIIGNLFGWLRRDKTRRYRKAFVFVPRKNGKTMLAAGIICYLLFQDGEPGAEIYGAANDFQQACLVFEHVRGMVLQEPTLFDMCKIYNGQMKAIQIEDDASYPTYRVIANENLNAHGFNTHGAVVDELHTQADGKLIDVLETSTGARRQPLIVYITTSDFQREGSICNEKHEYACKVRDGIIDDSTFLPVIFQASPEEDWTNPNVWHRANPNLGISLSEEYLEEECAKAKELSRFENTFKRLHLNIRTEQNVRWLPMDRWDACKGAVHERCLEGEPCFAGVDLATTSDIAALCLLFAREGIYHILSYFWVPEQAAKLRQRRNQVPYVQWIEQQLIEATPGDVVDYDMIRRRINELGERFNIREIAIDPWNSTQLQTQLAGDGFEIIKFGQGYASMSAPTKELEKLVLARTLRHGNNPVLRWMASNVSVEQDAAGNLKPSKKKSAEKIDGIVALVMALGRAMLTEGSGESLYESRGVLVV